MKLRKPINKGYEGPYIDIENEKAMGTCVFGNLNAEWIVNRWIEKGWLVIHSGDSATAYHPDRKKRSGSGYLSRS